MWHWGHGKTSACACFSTSSDSETLKDCDVFQTFCRRIPVPSSIKTVWRANTLIKTDHTGPSHGAAASSRWFAWTYPTANNNMRLPQRRLIKVSHPKVVVPVSLLGQRRSLREFGIGPAESSSERSNRRTPQGAAQVGQGSLHWKGLLWYLFVRLSVFEHLRCFTPCHWPVSKHVSVLTQWSHSIILSTGRGTIPSAKPSESRCMWRWNSWTGGILLLSSSFIVVGPPHTPIHTLCLSGTFW